MATSDELSAADLQRLARAEAPDLADAVRAFLAQPDTRWREAWVAHHLWAHGNSKYTADTFPIEPPSDMVKHRAHPDAWKRSPDALMRLLDTCQSDPATRFAIQGLRKDFPEALRKVTPA